MQNSRPGVNLGRGGRAGAHGGVLRFVSRGTRGGAPEAGERLGHPLRGVWSVPGGGDRLSVLLAELGHQGGQGAAGQRDLPTSDRLGVGVRAGPSNTRCPGSSISDRGLGVRRSGPVSGPGRLTEVTSDRGGVARRASDRVTAVRRVIVLGQRPRTGRPLPQGQRRSAGRVSDRLPGLALTGPRSLTDAIGPSDLGAIAPVTLTEVTGLTDVLTVTVLKLHPVQGLLSEELRFTDTNAYHSSSA